jgi:hypothetical protein
MLALLSLSSGRMSAWDGGGHMVIAAEAYRQLSPAMKSRVTELLKNASGLRKMGSIFPGDFYVKPGSKGIKLHSLWDGLLGTSGKPHKAYNYAIEI